MPGFLEDFTGGSNDDISQQLEKLTASQNVEDELASLKADLPASETKEADLPVSENEGKLTCLCLKRRKRTCLRLKRRKQMGIDYDCVRLRQGAVL